MNISLTKNNFPNKIKTINYGGELIDFQSAKVMGIVNITPDSFYDGGTLTTEKAILERVEKHLTDGATFIDIGAISARPGSKAVSEIEELERLLPAVKSIKKEFPNAIISIDTYRSKVADTVIKEGACIINDISSGDMDESMFKVIAKHKVPYIMMHIQGTPENMQQNPVYQNVTKDVIFYFSQKLEIINKLGINDVILDPGFGFGKTIEHNYQLLKELSLFKFAECPILVGISRKSMIYKLLNNSAQDALNGTTAVNTIALINGADILRVHDVKQAVETIKIVETLNTLK